MKGKTIKTTLFAAGVLLMSTPLVAAADTEGQVQEQVQEQAADQIQVVEENKVGWVQTEDGSWEYYLENNQGRVGPFRSGTDFFAKGQTVHNRHLDIGQDQIRLDFW